MTSESPIGMSNDENLDYTTDPEWIDEQIDRFLSWDYMVAQLTLDFGHKTATEICDKIGVHYLFYKTNLLAVRRRLKNGQK